MVVATLSGEWEVALKPDTGTNMDAEKGMDVCHGTPVRSLYALGAGLSVARCNISMWSGQYFGCLIPTNMTATAITSLISYQSTPCVMLYHGQLTAMVKQVAQISSYSLIHQTYKNGFEETRFLFK